MADFHLSRPAAGASQNITCAPDARFVFDFPTNDSTMTRNGDNLVFSFGDGSNVVLQDFYKVYNSEQLPSFAMEGQEVAAADFFAAMNQEDLMPAAGPSSNNSVQGHGHYNEYGDSALLSGLNRLDGEDVGWPGGEIIENVLDGGGEGADDEGSLPEPLFMAFTSSDALVAAANGMYSVSQPLGDGVVLTQDAIDAVNATITYGQFSLDGNGNLVFTQTAAYRHEEGTDSKTFDTVSFQVTDASGNVTTLNVTVTIDDDVPSVTAGDAPGAIVLDETGMVTDGGLAKVSGTAQTDFAITEGADTATVAYTLEIGTAPALTALIGGKEYAVTLSGSGTDTVTGMAGGQAVFTVAVDGNGLVTFTMTGAGTLKHADATDPDDAQAVTGLSVKCTVTDADGDVATASQDLTLTVKDDGPSVTAGEAPGAIILDETGMVGEGGLSAVTGTAQTNFTITEGADTATVAYTVEIGTAPALTALIGGKEYAVTLSGSGTDTVTGTADGRAIFTVTVDGNGLVTLVLTGAGTLKHADATDPDDAQAITGLSVKCTVTDADGDVVTASQDLTLTVKDDGPAVSLRMMHGKTQITY